jgi:ABC-type antimicrobial peptide transport system permease subunit
LTTAVRQAVASVDPTVPVPSLSIFDDLIAQKFVTRRLSVLLVSIFSGAALFLSAIGLYGVLAYSVSQRSRDLGIRMALGARTSNILALVSRQGLHLVGIGVVIGIGSALLLGRLIENVLYGVSATDPISLAISVFILGLAAFVACLLPALRATRISPITALRE